MGFALSEFRHRRKEDNGFAARSQSYLIQLNYSNNKQIDRSPFLKIPPTPCRCPAADHQHTTLCVSNKVLKITVIGHCRT